MRLPIPAPGGDLTEEVSKSGTGQGSHSQREEEEQGSDITK